MKTTAWDGTANGFWIAVGALRTPSDETAVGVLEEVIECAERSVRYWRDAPSTSAKPATIEDCHQCIEFLDVEINGAVQDYMRARVWAIKQIESGNRELGESLLKAMRGER